MWTAGLMRGRTVVAAFQLFDPRRNFPIRFHQLAHADKGAENGNTHLDGAITAQHRREHGNPFLVFGAAATTEKLLGLDQERLAGALGQAFVTAPIIYDIPRQNRPFYQLGWLANWHCYQMPGVAAEAGINAAPGPSP
jgi:hypothetical protein